MITPMTAAAVREAASTPLGRDRQNARRSRTETSEVSATVLEGAVARRW